MKNILLDSETDSDLEEEFFDLHKKKKALYEESPFYHHFWKMWAGIKDSCSEYRGQVTNRYYAVVDDAENMTYDFGAYLVKTFLPFAPIITGMMLPLVDDKVSRVSNAYSENHAKIYQNNILPRKKNNTVAEIVRAVISYNESLVREYTLNASGKQKFSIVETPHYPDVATNPLETEKWGRTKKEIEALNIKKKKRYNVFNSSIIKNSANRIGKNENRKCNEQKEQHQFDVISRDMKRMDNLKRKKVKTAKKIVKRQPQNLRLKGINREKCKRKLKRATHNTNIEGANKENDTKVQLKNNIKNTEKKLILIQNMQM